MAIIGGGHAGLAVSWYLTRDGIPHVVLERDTLMHARGPSSSSSCLWARSSAVRPNGK